LCGTLRCSWTNDYQDLADTLAREIEGVSHV
jgi:hypothetical protein